MVATCVESLGVITHCWSVCLSWVFGPICASYQTIMLTIANAAGFTDITYTIIQTVINCLPTTWLAK